MPVGIRSIPVYYDKDLSTSIGYAEVDLNGTARIKVGDLYIGVEADENAITLSVEGFTVK